MLDRQELEKTFKALGNRKRLQILELLLDRVHACCKVNQAEDCCMEEPTCDFGSLMDELDISKSSLSLHLKELRRAELVQAIKRGRHLVVQVNPDRLEMLKQFFEVSIDRHTRQWMEQQQE